MPPDPHEGNEVHNLDDVNARLYRRDLAGRRPRRIDSLHLKSTNIQKDWTRDDDPNAMKKSQKKFHIPHSFFRKFFFYSLAFAGVAILFAFIMFFTGGNTVSNGNIDINVLGNSFAAGGEELPLQVEVVNKNASALELADLFIEYDKSGDATNGASHVRDLNSLGTIGAGKTISKNIGSAFCLNNSRNRRKGIVKFHGLAGNGMNIGGLVHGNGIIKPPARKAFGRTPCKQHIKNNGRKICPMR